MVTNSLAAADVGAIKRKTLQLSFVAIASVFVFEFAAGAATNSLALLTDGTHALLDAVVTLVLLIASTLALRPRDTDHTYGHGKIETIGGFIGGAALFVIAAFFVVEAVSRIATGGGFLARPGLVGFAAIAYTLAVDVFRLTILRRAEKRTESATIKADFYHAVADLASTGVAFAGLWLVSIGFAHGDSAAAVVLGGVLSFLSIRLVYRNATELTDVISPKLVAKIQSAAAETDGVMECKDLKVRRVGGDVFVDATIVLRAHLSFEDAHATSDDVENNIIRTVDESGLRVAPGNINVHFEPTRTDSSVESIVEAAASKVAGVRGVHNILISKVKDGGSVSVSLHIQVRSGARLSEAHALADEVEDSIRRHLKDAKSITVHLEPHIQELAYVRPVSGDIQDSIRGMVLASDGVQGIASVSAYETDTNILKIDIGLIFRKTPAGEMTVDQIHERVSEIEERIVSKYPGSIVTIHAEPG